MVPLSQKDLETILKSFELFKGCEIEPEMASHKRYKKGRIICDNENGHACVVFVAHGSIEVYSVALDGKEIMLSLLEPGDCFGISNLFLTNTELPTVLKCSTDSDVLLIPKQRLIDQMQKDGILALRLAELYNQKIQFLLQKIEFLTMQSGKGKVVEFLLSHTGENGTVELKHSKESLASILGISRASLFRELSYLQSEDIISQDQEGIHIQDRARMEAILHYL